MKNSIKYVVVILFMPVHGMCFLCRTQRQEAARPVHLGRISESSLSRAEQNGILNLDDAFYPSNDPVQAVVECKMLAQRIKTMIALREVRLSSLPDRVPNVAGLSEITTALQTLPHLERITMPLFSLRKYHEATRDALVSLVANTPALRSVACADWECDDVGLLRMLFCLPHAPYSAVLEAIAHKPLTQLNLHDNVFLFINRGLRHRIIHTIVHLAPTLRELNVSMNSLGTLFDASCWRKMAPGLRGLKKLNLSWGYLGGLSARAWRALADSLLVSEVEDLDLTINDLAIMSDRSWRILTDMIADMPHLTKINLGNNQLNHASPERHVLLAAALLRNPNHPQLLITNEDNPGGFWERQCEHGIAVTIEIVEYLD